MKVGDTVEIVNIGKAYTTYETMAIKLGLPNYQYSKTPPAAVWELWLGCVNTLIG